MKLKKPIILVCCVIIAALGITLTGCSNSSSDKDAGNTTDMTVESSSDTNAESSIDMNAESSSDTNAESSTDTDVESSTDTNVENPYVGTWVATVAEYEGIEYDAEEVIGASEFIFHADGTGTFIGDGFNVDIEWEPTEDGLKFTDFNGDAYFTYKDGKLLLDVEMEKGGFTTAYFEKQKSTESSNEEYVESSEEYVESSDDKYADSPYVGTWVATVVEYEGSEYDAEEIIGATKFIFNADGTGKFIGDGMNSDIEWEPTEDGLKFTDFNGDAYFTYKDGKLLSDIEMEKGGFITSYFEKQK